MMPYSDDYEARTNIPIVQAATGFTASNGMRYILIFNEALWMPELHNSLMNPNQLRDYGVEVQDNPYSSEPITIRKDDGEERLVVCLRSQGTVIYLNTWTPTERDLSELRHITLTSDKVWDPQEVQFPATSESDINVMEGYNISAIEIDAVSRTLSYGDGYDQPMKIFDIQTFNAHIIGSSVIPTRISTGPLAEDKLMPPPLFISSERHSNTTPEDLSEVWNINVEQAKLTLEATTRHHSRSAIMPLSRQY